MSKILENFFEMTYFISLEGCGIWGDPEDGSIRGPGDIYGIVFQNQNL